MTWGRDSLIPQTDTHLLREIYPVVYIYLYPTCALHEDRCGTFYVSFTSYLLCVCIHISEWYGIHMEIRGQLVGASSAPTMRLSETEFRSLGLAKSTFI